MGEVEGSKGKPLAQQRVAIVGYGSVAREQALRLRLSGQDVIVAVRPGGMSWVRAVADGLRPVPVAEAVAQADVVVVHTPELEQPALVARAIAPSLVPGSLVVFTHATALHAAASCIHPTVDVVLVTTREPPWHVAVHEDATGRALERAIEYARSAIGATQVGTTSVASELAAELHAFAAHRGGMRELLAECDRVLTNQAHEPDEATLAYYEHLRGLVAEQLGPSPESATVVVSKAYRQRKRGAA